MSKKLLFTFFLFISLIGNAQLVKTGQPYKGLQAASDSTGKYWLLNKHDVKVIEVDSIEFSVTEALEKMEASTILPIEKQLYRRMVEAMPTEKARRERLWAISRSFSYVDPIVMEACYNSLLLKYGKRKLKKMLKRKK